jgi:proteasome lid subunit RPN8/RPN11
MLRQAGAEAPRECLGLLFGKESHISRRVPLENVSPVPEACFEAAANELLAALMEADALGEELVAVYHSHPKGPETPSPRDLEEARYGAPAVILVPEAGAVRAFDLMEKAYREREIVLREELTSTDGNQGQAKLS